MRSAATTGRQPHAAPGGAVVGLMLVATACGSPSVADYCDRLASCEQIESSGYTSNEACADENQRTIDCLNSSGRSQACAGAYEKYLGCRARLSCAQLQQQGLAQCEAEAATFSEKCQSIPSRCTFHKAAP